MAHSVTSEPEWIKSSLSFANGNCVEVQSLLDGSVNVRNSREPDGPVLHFTAGEWHDFIGGCKLGQFSDPGTQRMPSETGG